MTLIVDIQNIFREFTKMRLVKCKKNALICKNNKTDEPMKYHSSCFQKMNQNFITKAKNHSIKTRILVNYKPSIPNIKAVIIF